MARYLLQRTESSRCPTCNQYVALLTTDTQGQPRFYICFQDQLVFHVGKGPVPRDGE